MGQHHLDALRTCREHLLQEKPWRNISAWWRPLTRAMSSLGGSTLTPLPGAPRAAHTLPCPHRVPCRTRRCWCAPQSLLFCGGIKTNTSAGKCIVVVVLEINN